MHNELIIFDFFGVLCSEIAPVWFASRYDEEEAKRLKDHFFVKADLGEISMEDLFKQMSLELDIPIDTIKKEWEPLFVLNHSLFQYIKKLKQQYTVILLSNAPLGLLDDIIEKHHLRSYFDKIFISCHLKMAKPDINIYLHCIQSFQKQFDKIYMIDDNVKNLECLDKINIVPILFQTNEDVYRMFPISMES